MRDRSNQMLGYDRAITMFSPDGRLLQVEYAKKTVKQGTTAIGIVCKNGVVLVADKRVMDPLMVVEGVEKLFQVDDHIAVAVSGLVADGRVLVERAQVRAQQHRVTYDSPIDTLTIVKDISSLKQLCTQSGGLRPFGVSLMFVGVDENNGPVLFLTEPSGIYFQYKATVIGEGELEIDDFLRHEYGPEITIEDALKVAINGLKKFLGKEFSVERIEAGYIKSDERVFKKVSPEQLKKIK